MKLICGQGARRAGWWAAALGAALLAAPAAGQVGSGMTYQGEVLSAGVPASAPLDMRFTLHSAATGPAQVGAAQCVARVEPAGGRFTVALDFGAAAFSGADRWVEVEVRPTAPGGCANPAAYTVLSPRQRITSAPYAVRANSAVAADGATNAAALNGQPAAFYQNAANLTAGTLPEARLTANVPLRSADQTFAGTNLFTNPANQFNGAFAGSGAGLTGLNAGNVSSGTLADARLSGNVALRNASQAFTGQNSFTSPTNQFSGGFTGAFNGDGAGLTGLNAANVLGGTLADARLSGNVALRNASQAFTGQNSFSNGANLFTGGFSGTFSGTGTGLTALNASNIAGGTLADARLSTNVPLRNAANSFTGATNTFVNVKATGWIGSDAGAVEIRANNAPALRIVPVEFSSSPNVLAGDAGNTVDADVKGAVIAGGGDAPFDLNRVTDDFGTVGGGYGNTAGDGAGFTFSQSHATVSGGANNTASALNAAIGGGSNNTASGSGAAIGGGGSNVASGTGTTIGGGAENVAAGLYNTVAGGISNTATTGYAATVSGGGQNVASGGYAMVPGGVSNQAGGGYSFAAGLRAKVRDAAATGDLNGDEGTFVWADAQFVDFVSTGPNQFLIRSTGGVAINTASPIAGNALTVLGNTRATGTVAGTVKAFVIEHPLDPAKELWHASVESDELMTIYSGSATTDAAGYATVRMPAWFDALNHDVRYQLTVVDEGQGAWAMARVVRKLARNEFTLQTTEPGVEVSWQLTAVRRDAYAAANPFEVERAKAGVQPAAAR